MASILLKIVGQNKKILIYKKIKKWYNIYVTREKRKGDKNKMLSNLLIFIGGGCFGFLVAAFLVAARED